MSVVRRTSLGIVAAGLVLLGGPAWADSDDPCAPGPDGSVPEMCQSGPTEPGAEQPVEESTDPCLGAQPVEPGDGVVTDGDQSEGVAEGEPNPDAPVEDPADSSGDTKPDPGAEEPGSEPAPDEEPLPDGDAPTMVAPLPEGEEDGVACAYTSIPVSAPAAGAPEAAAGGTTTGATTGAGTAGGATGAAHAPHAASPTLAQLPRTGPYDRLLALAAVGTGLILLGAGVQTAGRRRLQQA